MIESIYDQAREKVFGIGLHKTGTTTLGRCLEILGYEPHISHHLESLRHWKAKDFDALRSIIDAHRSFEDWPWPLMYTFLYEHFPNSKFILTKRKSPEKWYSSLHKHAQRTGPTEYRQLIYGYAMPAENPDHHLQFYQKHNRAVEQFFKKHAPEKLLVVCWEDGDSWSKICAFLNQPIPDLPFPHLNHHQLNQWQSLKRKVYRWWKNK